MKFASSIFWITLVASALIVVVRYLHPATFSVNVLYVVLALAFAAATLALWNYEN